MSKAKQPKINVVKEIKVSFLVPHDPNALLTVRTEGMEKYGHPNFQVGSPPILRLAAAELILNLCNAVINLKEKFTAGESCDLVGFGEFHLEQGDENTLILVSPMPVCERCQRGEPHGDSSQV